MTYQLSDCLAMVNKLLLLGRLLDFLSDCISLNIYHMEVCFK